MAGMASLQSILASLGNAGAVANAHHGIEQREREDWLIARLESRLGVPAVPAAPAAPAGARPATDVRRTGDRARTAA
jgi:hypothetical protein